MYANYTGKKSRSFSTTDVYRIGAGQKHDDDDDDDDDSNTDEEMPPMQPRMSFSTLRRPIRRPTTRPPPVPPKRSDSFCSTTTAQAEADTRLMTEVRSYLSDDIRREFESMAIEKTTDNSSPRTSNFVKKLVATLERRQKDNNVVACKTDAASACSTTTHDIYKKSSGQLSRDDRCSVADVKQPTLLPPLDYYPKCKNSQLEQLDETDENEYDDFDSSESDDCFFSDEWRQGSSSRTRPPTICTAYPATASSVDQPNKSKTSGKRSLKNVFSSLINWRLGGAKSLPKGSREYYTTRESLGEEMRTFRRDTMPRLMERAAVNSRLPDLFRKRTSERTRRETQDFAKLINRPNIGKHREEPSPRSIATIHPIYGSSKATAGSQLHLTGLFSEPLYSSRFDREPLPTFDTPPQVFNTLPPPPPPPPPPAPPTITSSFSDEHLLRPSRLRDLQKRLSREIDCKIAAMQLRSSVTYDVPRSNRPVVVQEYTPSSATTHYQNIGQTTISNDKRLSCTLFTTF